MFHFHFVGVRKKLQERKRFCPLSTFPAKIPFTELWSFFSASQELKLFRDATRVMSEEVWGGGRGEFHPGIGNRDLGRVGEMGDLLGGMTTSNLRLVMVQACQPLETKER